MDDAEVLHVAARDIPIPTSVSPEAQAVLAMGYVGPPPRDYPSIDDLEGWRQYVAETNEFVLSMIGDPLAALTGTIETRHDLATCPIHVLTPADHAEDDRRVYFDVHGGAFVLGGGAMCQRTAVSAQNAVGAVTWTIDYRMPPDHPFPAGLDDTLAAYRLLLEQREAHEVVVGGSSAGGNMVAAMLQRARDEGLPMPAGAVFNSGGFDLTRSGDSFRTNDGLDNLLDGTAAAPMELFVGDRDPRDPLLSPLYADLSGFPPSILLTGTRDMLLSDSVRMHRALLAAGVAAELHVWEAGGHGGFLGMAPEDADRFAQMRRFCERCWSR